MIITYSMVARSIWLVWGLSWLAAARWSARTEEEAQGKLQAPYRLLNVTGFVCLFADGGYVHTSHGFVWHNLLPPLWRLPSTPGWLMTALVLGAFLFSWSARVTLGRLWSAAVTRKEGHHLVASGPYALVRHPIYTGLLAGAIGLATITGSPISVAGAVLMTIGYTLKARLEERFLASELGEADYAVYRARVPMLVPFAPF